MNTRIAIAVGVTASVLMFFVLAAASDRAEKSNLGTDLAAALVAGVIAAMLALLWVWAV